jgi:hypothetical protein
MPPRTRKLAVVAPDAPPPTPDTPKAPGSLREAAEHSERALLVALRTKIAGDIDKGVPPHTLAPLSKQLRELDRDIRALDVRAKEDADDGEDAPDEEFDASAI